MRKIADILINALAIFGLVLSLWVLISWANVMLCRPYIADWNIFKFF